MKPLDLYITEHGPLFIHSKAIDAGVHPQELQRARRDGDIVRVRPGAYVPASVWDDANNEDRYRLAVKAVLLQRPGALASHASAIALHGLPLLVKDVYTVHVMTDVKRRTQRQRLMLHPWGKRELPPSENAFAVASCVAVVQLAAIGEREAAVAAGDAALRNGLFSKETARLAVSLLATGHSRAFKAIELMDDKAESPGESRVRVMLLAHGFRVTAQHEIRLGGRVVRVDFAVMHPDFPGKLLLLEFDGAVKYAGEENRNALFEEKQREDALRALGYSVLRLVWADLDDDLALARQVRAALERDAPNLRAQAS